MNNYAPTIMTSDILSSSKYHSNVQLTPECPAIPKKKHINLTLPSSPSLENNWTTGQS